MHNTNTSLETLSVEASNLACISEVQLPPNLKRLFISHCPRLVIMSYDEVAPVRCVDGFNHGDTEDESSPFVTSSQSESNMLPETDVVANLSVHASLVTKDNQHSDLKYLHIAFCPELVCLSNSFDKYRSLEELSLFFCTKLKSLPSGMKSLTSLRTLDIDCCPIDSIPEGGLPMSLTCLLLKRTQFCKSLFEWGMHRLISLKLLRIEECKDVTSFLQEETGMVLPTSLMGLCIDRIPDLERLSSIAQNLTCLKFLLLFNCSSNIFQMMAFLRHLNN